MARKKGKRSKDKRRKFISKISSDGKISKKEGRKAAKKGISLRKIQNRNIGDYRQATRDFDRRAQSYRTPAAKRPTFEPLKIKRGAERADFARQMRDYEQRGGGRTRGGRARGGRGGGGGGSSDPGPTNPYQSEIENILNGEPDQPVVGEPVSDPYADAIADLQEQIAGMQMPDYGAELEAMRAEQARLMEEMYARQAEQERQRELAFRTSQENMARGGLTPDFRIGARSPRDRMGTGGFKRRPLRPATVAKGIAPAAAGLTINI